MKYVLFVAGLCLTTLSVFAQDQPNYSISVFSNNATGNVSTAKINGIVKKVHDNFPAWNVEIDQRSGTFKNIFGPAVALPGGSITEKIQYCIQQKLRGLDVNQDNWKQVSSNVVANATVVYYEQSFYNHAVAFSRLMFRLTPDGRVVRIQMKNYGTPDGSLTAVISTEEAKKAAVQDLPGLVIHSHIIAADWVWFPIPTDNGYVLHPAWHFDINAETQSGAPVLLKGYIDALNGNVLYRSNSVKDAIDLTVNASVYKNGVLNPATIEPLTDLIVKVSSTNYYTDTVGYFSNSTVVLPVTANVRLEGRWSKVVDNPTGTTPNFNFSVTSLGLNYTFATTSPSSNRHVNAYYHVNRVHNFMKLCYPSFTGMDFTLPTNVDLTSGACNAFYNGSSINFYAAGSGCESFAPIGTVVYHEYGHGISDKYYNTIKSGGSIDNGSLNEGNSDVWAMGVSHSPVVGEGAYTGGTGYIRRYDIGPKVYPNDLTGEVHANGAIIAGAWWDVAVNMGSVDSMAKLFSLTYNDVSDGPDGTEGDVYHQVLISALMNDDIDANINNGTPHFAAIVKAFAKHGIYLLSSSDFTHTELSHQPSGVLIPVTASLTNTYPFFLKDVLLFYRPRTTSKWDTLTMTNTTGTTYEAQIPAQAKGTILDYFFALRDTMNMVESYYPENYNPTNALFYNTLPYQFGIGIASRISNDFESSTAGWTIGHVTGDDATGGIWVCAVPVRSSVNTGAGLLICQTGADHTTGTGKCLVTGNAASIASAIGTADVDNGKTTIITPAFDLSGFANPVIEYYRWYGNDRSSNPREDMWMVQVRDSPSTTWFSVDRTYQSDYNWRRRIFALKEFSTARKNVQFRFIAQDPVEASLANNGQSVVEAAMDDFTIYDLDNATEVPNIPAEHVQVYPNPAHDKLRVSLPALQANGNIQLCDVSGKILLNIPLNNHATEYEINISEIAGGQYFLLINTPHSIQSQKIVINH